MSTTKIVSQKQPFLPSTRSDGNVCFCAACGSVNEPLGKPPRASVQLAAGNAPFGWVARMVVGENLPEGRAHVFTCDRCLKEGVDGPAATAYYDRYDMQWSSSSKRWDPIPAKHVPPAAQVPVSATQEEKTAMTTNGAVEKVGFKAKAIGQAKDLGGAAALGVKLAMTDEVGEMFIDLLMEFGKDNPMIAAFLSDESGREIAKLLMAASTHTMCEHTNMIPQSAFVKKAAELQVTASFETLAKPQMKNVRKAMGKLALIGQKMAELEGAPASASAEDEDETPAASSKASARAR
jgi:hypothetical protein